MQFPRQWPPEEPPRAIRAGSCSFFRLSFRSLMFYTTEPEFSLELSFQNQQQNHAHRQVRQNQQDKEAIAAVEASCFVENALVMSSYRQPVQVARNILAKVLNGGITRVALFGSGFCANGFE